MEPYRKTIADRWREHGCFPDGVTESVKCEYRTVWEDAVVLRVNADLMFGTHVPDATTMLPMVLPPWRTTCVELDVANTIGKRDRYGVLVLASRSLIGASLWPELDDGRVIGPVAGTSWQPTESGDARMGDIVDNYRSMVRDILDRMPSDAQRSLCMALFAGIYALSLVNCKNVTRVRHSPPAALSRRQTMRGGRPLCRYYTLDIEPMRTVLNTEGRMGEVGLAKALHLCRGHFKDYREGGGLFGKHKGLYWWDANVRGSVSAGVVAKDYAIKG